MMLPSFFSMKVRSVAIFTTKVCMYLPGLRYWPPVDISKTLIIPSSSPNAATTASALIIPPSVYRKTLSRSLLGKSIAVTRLRETSTPAFSALARKNRSNTTRRTA